MSKQSHKYITDVWSFLWGLESEVLWLELSDTEAWLWHSGVSPVAQREGHTVGRPQADAKGTSLCLQTFPVPGESRDFLSTALKTKAGLGDFCVCTN